MFFLFLLLVATLFFLVRSGRISPPPWIAQHRSPEGRGEAHPGRAVRPR